jgi:hypothetical protein
MTAVPGLESATRDHFGPSPRLADISWTPAETGNCHMLVPGSAGSNVEGSYGIVLDTKADFAAESRLSVPWQTIGTLAGELPNRAALLAILL